MRRGDLRDGPPRGGAPLRLRGGGRRVRQQSITPSKAGAQLRNTRRGRGGRRRVSSVRLAHPGLAAVVDVAPAAAAELVPGPRTEASRRSGIGAAATDRGVEPDVLPTAGVRLADRTRTFTPPAPGDLSTPSKSRGHASPKTTKLYDRTVDTVTVDEIPLGNGILTIVQKCSNVGHERD